jgi:hypothetical protein
MKTTTTTRDEKEAQDFSMTASPFFFIVALDRQHSRLIAYLCLLFIGFALH